MISELYYGVEGFLKYRPLQMVNIYIFVIYELQKFCEPQVKVKFTRLQGARSTEGKSALVEGGWKHLKQ